MVKPIRWGILGTGGIAKAFARGLATLDDAELVAVGSRSVASAEAFGETFQVPHRHGSYAELAANPEVEVIYVASPHSEHYAHTMLMLQAGKAVLCEKAFTINAAEAEKLISEATERGLFLMEAMWMRFLPHIQELRRLIDSGAIGEPRLLSANFCINAPADPQGRLLNPELGGGALLDLGVYPINLASVIFGDPDGAQNPEVSSSVSIGPTGVDEQAGLLFKYPGGQTAILGIGLRSSMPMDAVLGGTQGLLRIKFPWFAPTSLTLEQHGQEPKDVTPADVGNGYAYEAAEVMRCMRAGLIESPIMPHAVSLNIMRLMDTLRAGWGLRYANDDIV